MLFSTVNNQTNKSKCNNQHFKYKITLNKIKYELYLYKNVQLINPLSFYTIGIMRIFFEKILWFRI